jgi:RimJ/RimL family protein N-acetyltransferase
MLTQHEISLEEHRNWFALVKEDKTRQQLIVLDGADPLGFVQFNPVCQGGVADWGFYVRPDAPKGSGTKLGQTALAHAFRTLGLHKVCGQAIENNMASIAFHGKLGFAEEGRLREQQRIANQYHTLFCFGLLAKDWQASQIKQEQPHATN